jgi:ribosomal protein L16 Arg81 hydroxylase
MNSQLTKEDHNPYDLLQNTSRIDVFRSSDVTPRLTQEAMTAVLEPGDLLYMPPLWWHAMRSEDISASVSMWF